MQIIDNKALLLKLRHPKQVLAAIPDSKAVGPNEVAVRWDVPQVHALRSMDIPAPSPIEGKYSWPGRFKPFEHQKKTAAFLTNNRRAFCFSHMGTGKTASAIWAADFLMSRGLVRRALVICPMSIMDSAWRADLFSFAMHRKVDIAHGSAKKRKEIIASDAEFVIINFDGVEIVEKDIAEGGFDLIIVDEASAYKRATTKRWKCLNRLVGPDTWLWMMTGTPAAQGPEDAYGLAKLVNPRGVPRTFGAFRDMVMFKVTQFKWVPKATATETVHRALQPAIRYTKEECLDLPDLVYVKRRVEMTPQQKKYYDVLRKRMVMEASGEAVTAVNAAVKATKLLQIACIVHGTPVLCRRGWVPIQDVTPADLVWDGIGWARCDGAVYRGRRAVMSLDGVRLTPDHKVLTVDGWKDAEEAKNGDGGKGFDRAGVRLPDGYSPGGKHAGESKEGSVGVQVSVRDGGDTDIAILAGHEPPRASPLRLPAREQNARHDRFTAVPSLARNAPEVHGPHIERLRELRRAGHHGVPEMGSVIRGVSRGHGSDAPGEPDTGSHRQQRPVQPGELSVGFDAHAEQQHPAQSAHTDPKGRHDSGASGSVVRAENRDFARPAVSVPLALGESADNSRQEEVYDVLNCGPRNRFVVRGEGGQLLIVHNCGAVYTDDGETLEFDIKNRYSVLHEVIGETSNKVLVFVPFQHTIQMLADQLKKDGITAEVVNGSVSATARADLFRRFQQADDPRVLVIQPQAAAHGVTLTAADTIVWWAPTASLEIYAQANARIHRSGQVNKCTVVQLEGSSVERHIYELLDNKIDVHSKIVELYNDILD